MALNPFKRWFRKKTASQKTATADASEKPASKPKPSRYYQSRIPTKDYLVAPKLRGLSWLKNIAKPLGARVLPYQVIRKPDSFSMAKISQQTPARVLVRSDIAPKRFYRDSPHLQRKGITNGYWGSLPRQTFTVDQKNPAKTEAQIKQFLKEKPAQQGQFYIIHPLRPEQDYDIIGQVTFNRGELMVKTGKSKTHHTFRHEYTGEKISSKLEAILEKITEAIKKKGITQFQTSFVTYKDAPDVPEFYDFLMFTPGFL